MNEALDPADFRRKEREREMKQINRKKIVFGITEEEKIRLERLQKNHEKKTKSKNNKVIFLALKQLNLLK
jgi:hypothetical protein